MKFRTIGSVAAVAVLTASVSLYSAHAVRGSDHQDAPAVLSQPGADITDVYVFPSPVNPKNVDLAMDVTPLIPAGMSGKYSFDPSVLYQFKITHGAVGTTSPEDLVIGVVPNGTGPSQTFTLYGPRRPQIVGTENVPSGAPMGTFGFNQTSGTTLMNGVTAFAGPRADPFFFDLFQFFKILPDRYYANPRTGDKLGTSTPTFNGYSSGSLSGPGGYACSTAPSTNALTQIGGGFNVLTLLVEVPRSLLMEKGQSPIIHVWATASDAGPVKINRKQAYHQVELLSRPAVKELFETFKHHEHTNISSPYADPLLQHSIGYFMNNIAGRSPQISSIVQTILYPNEMAADLSQTGPAAYLGVETGGATGGKFGGRGLTDDVIDISLGAVFGNTVPALTGVPDDKKENNCLTSEHVTSGQGGTQTQSTFPYFAAPH